MTEQVDFYILSTSEGIPFTCRLLEKAFQEQHRIHVQTHTADEAKALNEALWTFRDISFVPHKLVEEAGSPQTPISISHNEHQLEDADILVLAGTQLPAHYEHYARVIAIVPNNEDSKQQARHNYQQLKNQGHSIQVHNL